MTSNLAPNTTPTWTQLSAAPTGGLLAVDPQFTGGVFLATSTGFLSTSNSGFSWTSHVTGLPNVTLPPFASAMAVAPNGFNTVYLGVSNRGLWKTTTAGM